jgi:hypothetical protein
VAPASSAATILLAPIARKYSACPRRRAGRDRRGVGPAVGAVHRLATQGAGVGRHAPEARAVEAQGGARDREDVAQRLREVGPVAPRQLEELVAVIEQALAAHPQLVLDQAALADLALQLDVLARERVRALGDPLLELVARAGPPRAARRDVTSWTIQMTPGEVRRIDRAAREVAQDRRAVAAPAHHLRFEGLARPDDGVRARAEGLERRAVGKKHRGALPVELAEPVAEQLLLLAIAAQEDVLARVGDPDAGGVEDRRQLAQQPAERLARSARLADVLGDPDRPLAGRLRVDRLSEQAAPDQRAVLWRSCSSVRKASPRARIGPASRPIAAYDSASG